MKIFQLAFFVLIGISLLGEIEAQNYKFKNFGASQGICDPYIYTLNQDNNGYLWVGTGVGLCRFDGFNFIAQDDSITAGLISTSFKDSDGNIWFGYDDGRVIIWDGKKFEFFQPEGISGKIAAITEYKNEILIASQSNGIIFYSNGKQTHVTGGLEGKFISSLAASDDILLVGTMEGLVAGNADHDGFIPKYAISELDYVNIITLYHDVKNQNFIIGTDGEGFQTLSFDQDNYFINKTKIAELKNATVNSFTRDNQNQLWISTNSGIFKILTDGTLIHYNSKNGLSENYTRIVFEDLEGNVWIGTYGGGLDQKMEDAFIFYDSRNIISIIHDQKMTILGLDGNIEVITPTGTLIFGEKQGIPSEKITSLALDGSILYFGTAGSGVFELNIQGKKAKSIKIGDVNLSKKVNHLLLVGKDLYVSTYNGVYIYDIASKSSTHLGTSDGLPHNTIYCLTKSQDGKIWISGKSNALFAFEGKKVKNFPLPDNFGELDIRDIASGSNGDIWVATTNQGVIRYKNEKTLVFNSNSGLKSNFCSSISIDTAGKIWVGHSTGLSTIIPETNLVKSLGQDQGFGGAFNAGAAYAASNGLLYFGTTDGYVVYNIAEDKGNKTAPMVNISQLTLNDKVVDLENIISLPYGIYKLKIEFVGINLKAPQEVSYQYMFQGKGFDSDFGEISANKEVTLNNIRDGNYNFVLKAFNNEGISTETPFILKIAVKSPFWKTWWFISMVILFLVGSVYFIILYRERKQRLLNEYLERELALRTKEVVEQKEEIEIKNRDITDSINYAQRIQASILPSIKTLEDNFTGSFVFYLPRDIVSGDFYWFDKISEDKFMIVCADSTGHGVPGAFMSMIGTTLIKDICFRNKDQSPFQVLQQLDKQLNTTLNQNIDAEKSSDGMDIIVCEINLKTNLVRIASAMRPIIVFKNGEEIYLKGSRASIGGNISLDEKDFEQSEIQLSKGDLIYMFSDGYPDQFGGPTGKKFKMVRLKNMLTDIQEKPMDQQLKQVKTTFEIWKGKMHQIDDVLFMGIKI